MRIRQLLTASALYGLGDMLVLGVGGFLLLPLYTRTLSQAEFGGYIVVKTNIELVGYLVCFGLLSAVGRVYFDHRAAGEPRRYMNSILMFFLMVVTLAAAAFIGTGDSMWRLVSPSIPSWPYLWYALGVAALTFTAGLGSLWLRIDQQVGAFVGLQLVAAVVLAVTAFVNLEILHLGLPGLLAALAIGYLPATLSLIWRIGVDFRPRFRRTDIGPSLQYGMPFAVSYIAYFILNRFSLLTLQWHVTLEDVAIFGLAQQLALVINICSQSFGKAMQPAVFGATPDKAPGILRRSSRLFILLIFGAASGAVMFAGEIVRIVAPSRYHSGVEVFLVLLIAAYVHSFSLVSSTVLEYHRRPRASAAMSVLGAIMSVVLGLVLIPSLGLIGGAIAILGANTTTTVSGHILAWRISGQSYVREILAATAALVCMALVSAWQGWNSMSIIQAGAIKLAVVGAAFAGMAALCIPGLFVQMRVRA
jgi:O-antigen/teichoic acid export membrane protein